MRPLKKTHNYGLVELLTGLGAEKGWLGAGVDLDDATDNPEFAATPLEDGRGPIGVVGFGGGVGPPVGRAWAKSAVARTVKARTEPKRVKDRSLE